MKTLKEYMECPACNYLVWQCFRAQEEGLDVGLDFDDYHLGYFSIDPKTNKFVSPIYSS